MLVFRTPQGRILINEQVVVNGQSRKYYPAIVCVGTSNSQTFVFLEFFPLHSLALDWVWYGVVYRSLHDPDTFVFLAFYCNPKCKVSVFSFHASTMINKYSWNCILVSRTGSLKTFGSRFFHWLWPSCCMHGVHGVVLGNLYLSLFTSDVNRTPGSPRFFTATADRAPRAPLRCRRD